MKSAPAPRLIPTVMCVHAFDIESSPPIDTEIQPYSLIPIRTVQVKVPGQSYYVSVRITERVTVCLPFMCALCRMRLCVCVCAYSTDTECHSSQLLYSLIRT